MKKLSILLLSLIGFMALSGCVAYPAYDGHGPQYRGGQGYGGGDRDRDGVRNRDDRRPNDPNRY
ncbi:MULTISPECIES: hypothetical protein [Polaromonas]|uniref:Lipoprotein n=1 Tax=Polaromonas aquatica TaxID=332657 RepID=A0ABW1U198_9BURK